MSRPLAILALLLCTLFWGFAFVAQKTAMQSMGPLTFTAARYILGALLILPLAYAEFSRGGREKLMTLRHFWPRIIALCLAFFLGTWLQQAALVTTSATNGGFLTSLYVIFTPLVVYATARLAPHRIIYIGAPLALAGIYFLTGANLHDLNSGDVLLIACALCWAVQVAMLGELVRETRMPFFFSAASFLTGACLAGVGAALFETPNFAGIASGWIEVLYAGVLSTAVAFSLQAVGQQYVPPANAALILSTESLFAALGGALLLHERLSPLSYVGALLIFVAIVLVEYVSSKPAAPPAKPINNVA